MKLILRGLVVVSSLTVLTSIAQAEPDIVPDVVYGHKHGMALTLDVFKPTDANGAGVLFMVSGGWNSRWYPPQLALGLFRPLLEKGFTVFAVRHGSSPKYKIPEIVEDVRRSVRFVRTEADRFGVDAERLGVFGGSAGGHLSLMLASTADEGKPDSSDNTQKTTNRVAAVVAYFPPTDLRGLVNDPPNDNKRFPALNFSPDKAVDYSPIAHVSPDDPPTLLIHGDKDDLVPLRHSTSLLEALQKHEIDSELIVIEGAGHGFEGDDRDQATQAMVTWFEKHLGGK